jgi:hypothetical protein
MNRLARLLLTLMVASPAAAFAVPSGLIVTLESGPAYVFQNDGRYGADGTLFHAGELGEQRVLATLTRAGVELRFGEHHGIELLYVPVRLDTTARLTQPLVFKDTRFDPGDVLDYRYVFDGYRLSYFYRLVDSGPIRFDLGGAFQIRSATVELGDVAGTRLASESNIGPVFALAVRLRYRLGQDVFAELEATGFSTFGRIGSTKGSILDAQLAVGTRFGRGMEAFAGLRLYGGGADTRERNIYNFAWFGQASLGLRADLISLFGEAGS